MSVKICHYSLCFCFVFQGIIILWPKSGEWMKKQIILWIYYLYQLCTVWCSHISCFSEFHYAYYYDYDSHETESISQDTDKTYIILYYLYQLCTVWCSHVSCFSEVDYSYYYNYDFYETESISLDADEMIETSPANPSEEIHDQRTYFPETWLWKIDTLE